MRPGVKRGGQVSERWIRLHGQRLDGAATAWSRISAQGLRDLATDLTVEARQFGVLVEGSQALAEAWERWTLKGPAQRLGHGLGAAA